jgi:magnesium transporter
MIHIRIRKADGTILRDLMPEDLHDLIEEPTNLVWLDLESPSDDELGLAAGILGWEHLTVEDLIEQGQRAKIEQFKEYTVLVMNDLAFEGTPSRLQTPEVDFVIGKNYIASVHQHRCIYLEEARDGDQFIEAFLARGPDFLLYAMIDALVDGYEPVLDVMHEEVEALEQAIIDDPQPALLARIFELKRDAISLRRVISPQLEVFARLTSPGYGIIGEQHIMYFRDVHDHLIRTFEAMDTLRELISGSLDVYLSNVSNRMNEVMKRLTVVAALFLPITFFTGLMGMNLPDSPLWSDKRFWFFIAGMLTVTTTQFLYMRSKKWT